MTGPDWQPPSPEAIQTADRFLVTARFALRFWPVETLLGVVQDSAPAVSADQMADKRLALQLLSEATHEVPCHFCVRLEQ